jgi:hypothetical protein
MSQVIRLLFIAGITLMTLGYQACSQIGSPASGSSQSNSDADKMGGTTTDNPITAVNVVIANSGMTTSSNIQLCLGQIQFSNSTATVASPDSSLAASMSDINSNLNSMIEGEMSQLNAEITQLTDALMGSLSVPTSGGVLSSIAPLVLHFTGNLTVSASGQFVLDAGDILTALANAQAAADLSSILSSVSGTF